jgi:cell division protein FtsX
MAVVVSWLRLELRRRWRSLTVLALLIAVTGGVVFTSLAAARRGASALTRLEHRTLPATTAVLANTPGFDWTKIEALPEVAALTKFVVDYSFEFEGIDSNGVGVGFPPADDAFMRTIEKPVVFSGRNLDPTREDEAVVTREFVKTYHKGVGDTVMLHLPSAKQLADSATGAQPTKLDGPRIRVHIVGVVLSPWISDAPDSPGGIQMSPGVVAHFPNETLGDPAAPDNLQFVNALVRLRGGEADVTRFRDDIARLTGRSDIDVWNLPDQQRAHQHETAFESRCLVAFAAAAFIAALFLIGQAIVRYAAASTTELQTLRALGMTPWQAVATAAVGPAIVGIVGALLAAAGAYVASWWFPYGTASLFESTPGRDVDWMVFAPGIAVVVLLVAGGAAAAARLALGAARRGLTSRRSAVATTVARGAVAVPVVVGTRFALESGRGRTSVPVRPALIGAVTGVLGIVAAFTFSHGVSDAASHPERFGQTFQLTAFVGINGDDGGPVSKLLSTIVANKDVAGVDDARTAVATGPGGKGSVSLWEYQPAPKPIPVVLMSGRMPESATEVLLAPQSMASLHAHIGDRVSLTGSKKGASAFTVTGEGLVPIGPHNGYADGGWVTTNGFDSIFDTYKFRIELLALRSGADPSAVAKDLAAAVAKQVPDTDGLTFDPPDVPTEVAEIRQVRVLPIVLGAFLALLAVGAVGHALATAVRRRSHDLAVLRALGMTRRQCRWVVVTQATVLAVIGLLFGMPLGLAIGRSVWRVVADYTPIQYVSPTALWALALVGPGALVIANLLAAWPGHRAARLRIAQILRAE